MDSLQHETDFSLNESLQNVSKNLRIVSICTIGSRILGLMRDRAMGVLFGAGPVMDAFTVAFRLPNLARVLLGEGALTTAFLPVFVSDLRERGSESAARVTWAVFLSLAAFLCSMIVLFEGAVWSLALVMQLSPEATLLRNLSALLMPYVMLICLAAQLGAVLNALGKFVWPALVPSILNLVWLLSLWGLAPLWTDEVNQAYVIGVCVLIGGVLQLLFPLLVLYSSGFGFRSDWRLAMGRVWKIATDMLPVIIGMSVTQLNAVLDSFIAWGFTQPADLSLLMPLPGSPQYPLPEGTATALYLGQRLYQFPLGVFGVALGTVLFPLLTSHAQRGETDKLRSDLSLGVRLVIAIGLPASAGLILIGHPLATLFFEYGKFNAEDARQTGDMIAAYGSGVWAYCGLLILQRGFYAIGDRLTPMYIGLAAMFANLFLNLTLIWPLGGRGLALATAIVAACQCASTALVLQRHVGRLHWGEIGRTTLKTIVATAVMSVICQVLLNLLGSAGLLFGRAIRLGVPLTVGGMAFLLSARLLGLVEPWLVIAGKRSPVPNLES
jgi:putative peptidoglycan lipid II flippase